MPNLLHVSTTCRLFENAAKSYKLLFHFTTTIFECQGEQMCFPPKLYWKTALQQNVTLTNIFCAILCHILIGLFVDVGCSSFHIWKFGLKFQIFFRILPQAVFGHHNSKVVVGGHVSQWDLGQPKIYQFSLRILNFCHRRPKYHSVKGPLIRSLVSHYTV